MSLIEVYNFVGPSQPLNDIKVEENNQMDCNSNEPNVEEKLKVNRKKFEDLLERKDDESAEKFFGGIESMFPSVEISYPHKLKVGTKSKKDPHIKISGLPSMVKSARIKILETLDPKRDRVTLKMDIDWTAHSHIIGKSGSSIQKVMDSTECHVHFPDANRTNGNEKSNQVSISGTPLGVKEARIALRELLPLIVSFNVLLRANYRSVFVEPLNRIIQFIERLICVQITVRFTAIAYQRSDSIAVSFFVRGVYGKRDLIPFAIDLLNNFIDKYVIKNEVIYQINTEISANHHNSIIGYNQSNLRDIMRVTETTITFPTQLTQTIQEKTILSRLMSASLSQQTRNTTVNIKGTNVTNVLKAFDFIVKHLPLSLTFDLKEGHDVSTQIIDMLGQRWSLFITVKPKPKQNSKTIWIRGPEKDEWKLFEVRKYLIESQLTNTVVPLHLNSWSPSLYTSGIWSNSESVWIPKSQKLFTDDLDSSYGGDNSFEKAPGAERMLKI